MTSLPTYSEIEHALESLGFVRHHVEDSHFLFAHADTEAGIVLLRERADTEVRPHDFAKVRHALVEYGLVDSGAVDSFLRRQPVHL